VGAGIDVALAQLSPVLRESAPGPRREAVLAALNGVLGDYLSETGNPLAIQMALRSGGRPLRLEPEALRAGLPLAGGKVVMLVHGSSMNDLQWNRLGHDHGAALARDLGFTPVYLHYNSGLHISTNGRAFANLLEALVRAWPVPLEGLVLLGHSMGGLLARSASLAGETEGHLWRRSLRKLICLGAPHHGAPLERGGSWVDLLLGVSRYSAPFGRLGRIRSAGVTDLRFGNVLDEHWAGRNRFGWAPDVRQGLALPEGVACYAAAATTALERTERLPGDGLVPVDSALGRHSLPALTLRFPEANQWVGLGMRHLDLLSHPEVYATLRGWLSP
jgi:pimeloyl-ACP methyl ester carboxylesterase